MTDTALYNPNQEDDEKCPFTLTVKHVKNDNNPLLIIENKGRQVFKCKKRMCSSFKIALLSQSRENGILKCPK